MSAEEGTGKAAAAPPAAAPEPKKGGGAGRIILYLLLVLAVLAVVAYLSIGVTVSETTEGASYPYTTTYDVLFPSGEVVRIGNMELIAIPLDDKVTLSINKEPKEIAKGETKEVSRRHASIGVLGMTALEFDFRIQATYLGKVGDRARFYLAFQTSRQVWSFLIDRLLPGNIQARPA
jgi:hypothetical protein